MTPLASSLVLALTLAGAGARTLDVPFLSQTPALCGGAAAAMVFRYWGDRHADMQQFAPLVDRRAGGIADDALIGAVRQRGWRAEKLAGSVDVLYERLAAGQPVIILIEDGPTRYHYVVVVGADDDGVLLHDPTWGPSRRYTTDRLVRLWRRSNFWALVVLPEAPNLRGPAHEPTVRRADLLGPPDLPSGRPDLPSGPPDPAADLSAPPLNCDRLLDSALDEIAIRGLASAEEVLSRVMSDCPDSAAPLAEMAAVRFAEKRWNEAEALAYRAVTRDPAQQYAWDVLGSARFIRNDLAGALRAWNRIGKPLVDSVVISGLSRTRYALVAEALEVAPNAVLTEQAYRLAARRVRQLPGQSGARVAYRPEADGFAKLDVAVMEPAFPGIGLAASVGIGAQAALQRSVHLTIPGWTGQGETWAVSWRWWNERPRLGVRFSAPRVGRLPGVTHVDFSQETESYATGAGALQREDRLRGRFVLSDWATASLRYEIEAGADSFDVRRRTVSLGGLVERRMSGDRAALAAAGYQYVSTSGEPGFAAATLAATYRSSTDLRPWVYVANAGVEAVTSRAPLAMWPGAGEGQARTTLLRAHPLLDGGVIAGEVFGRRLVHAGIEAQRWLARPSVIRLGLALFADLAAAGRGFSPATPLETDVGLGVRVRVPGSDDVIRVDYARGLRDGSSALTAGLVTSRW